MIRDRKENSPFAAGFQMPAEWEPHAATWIGWPHNAEDWPGKLAAIQWAYGEIVRHLVPGELVRILVKDAAHEQQATQLLSRVGVDLNRVEFFQIRTNRGWTRDFGPIFVRNDATGEVAIARFRFNGWAKYDDWQLDDAVPDLLADRLGLRSFPIVHAGASMPDAQTIRDASAIEQASRGVVMEGGAIDVNGAGTLLTTEECLLEVGRIANPSYEPHVQVRNPGMSREQMESVFEQSLGASNVIWLGQGILGDDTHGHVDDLCRFVNRNTVVLAQETNPDDANYGLLQENRERLHSARLEDGSKLEVVTLPMPRPLSFDGVRLPASYANFYIANAAVLVPTFNDASDRIALGVLSELFTECPVIGIHAIDLVWGLGTLHCLTQQQPMGHALG